MPVYKLDNRLWFPDPRGGNDDGLIAVGGDLSPERLILAYSNGIFPWYAYHIRREPKWYCPLKRYVIFPGEIHISHSMRQLMRNCPYDITVNQDFEAVIASCSKAQGRNEDFGAWLGPDIIKAYTRLHKMGIAASVEVWQQGADGCTRSLVGGLYGVALRRAFFGESMFSLVPNASKLALIHLADCLAKQGAHFIDCQFETPHFRSMGGRYISYEEYMRLLESE